MTDTNRGRPLPWRVREEIKRLTTENPKARVARELGLSRNTVAKYAAKQV